MPGLVAVTGGLGFIGTSLVPRLRDRLGMDVRILDNLSNPSGELTIGPGIEVLQGDIRDAGAVDRFVRGADAVIHLAGHTRVTDSIEDPAVNFEINVIGGFRLLEAMRRHGVGRFVNASTGGAILGEVAPPVHEDMPPRPSSPYGASKLAVEGYCSSYAQSYGMKTASLRFSNIYGPHSRGKKSVVAAFLKAIRDDGRITIYGDGSQTRDYLYVDDLVDGILAAITHGANGVYQLGSGRGASIDRLVDILRRVVDRPFAVDKQAFRAGEVVHTYCDIGRAHRDFGFAPAVDLEEGVRRTWAWFTASSDGGSPYGA